MCHVFCGDVRFAYASYLLRLISLHNDYYNDKFSWTSFRFLIFLSFYLSCLAMRCAPADVFLVHLYNTCCSTGLRRYVMAELRPKGGVLWFNKLCD